MIISTCGYALGLLTLILPGARGQTLQGTVRNTQHIPLAEATVYVQFKEPPQTLTGRTDAEGRYRFPLTRGGMYTLRAVMAGYKEALAGPFVGAKTTDLVLATEEPAFFDEPQFVVAGVTEAANGGGHGSDTVLRSTEALAKATASLGSQTNSGAESERSVREAIAREPGKADFHHRLGDIEERLGKPLEAVREYQRAAELVESESNFFDWGAELLTHRAADPAIEVFTKGYRLYPRSVRLVLGLAAALYAHGFYDEAARRFFEASDLSPVDPIPYQFLGMVQNLEIVQLDGFVERLERFAKLQPDNATAVYYYAVSLFRRWSNERDAETFTRIRLLLEKAVQLDPKLSAAYVQLGILDAEQKDLRQAIVHYQRAIQLNPQMEEAHYRLGLAYARTGEKLKSEKELAIHEVLAKKSAAEFDRERRDILNFVFSLRGNR